jgi:hypothetical protein
VGLVETVPVIARDRKVKALWSHLSGFGVPSGFVRMWGSHPAEPSSGFTLSNYFHLLHQDPSRAAFSLFPRDLLPEVTARAVRPEEVSPETLLALAALFIIHAMPGNTRLVYGRREKIAPWPASQVPHYLRAGRRGLRRF